VVQDTSNPVFAKTVYGGLPAPSERLADLAIGNASQRALKAQGTTVRPGALPPSLISGIGITLPRESQTRISTLALDALTATPLSSEALRQLAYIEPDQARRVRLLSLAQAVTRAMCSQTCNSPSCSYAETPSPAGWRRLISRW
jgi:hypothetical protein